MRCVKCGRHVTPGNGIEIPTREGPWVYGPKCAKAAGLVKRSERKAPVIRRSRSRRVNEAQMELGL